MSFESDLEKLINSHNKESDCDTPDYILSNYLENCLNAFKCATILRDKWYQKDEADE